MVPHYTEDQKDRLLSAANAHNRFSQKCLREYERTKDERFLVACRDSFFDYQTLCRKELEIALTQTKEI